MQELKEVRSSGAVLLTREQSSYLVVSSATMASTATLVSESYSRSPTLRPSGLVLSWPG